MLGGRPVDRRKAPRITTNGRMPGRMLLAATGADVPCQSFDVSRIGLGISSDVDISQGAELLLLLGERQIRFRVVVVLKATETWSRRYGLLLEDEQVDLEAEFRASACLVEAAPGAAPSRESAPARSERAPRFIPEPTIRLQVRTFGTREPYDLTIENLSRTGILVALATDESLPFRVNTLLNLTIDPDCRAFPQPIEATGKIVRRIDEEPPGKTGRRRRTVRLGIAISEFQSGHEPTWMATLNSLESIKP